MRDQLRPRQDRTAKPDHLGVDHRQGIAAATWNQRLRLVLRGRVACKIDLELRFQCAAVTPGGDRRPNDRALPYGRAADAIDSKLRSQGAGNRTSIPASRQWAEIHIARLGTGEGRGTDPRARIEAADPIDSARRGRSNPRPPPARATRRVEIYARASSFGLPETSLSAAVLRCARVSRC